jgi:hypothetical protein
MTNLFADTGDDDLRAHRHHRPGTAKAKATRACLDYLESLRADFGEAE